MATGLSTMSLMRVTNSLTTPYNSPMKEDARTSKCGARTQGAKKGHVSRRLDVSADGEEQGAKHSDRGGGKMQMPFPGGGGASSGRKDGKSLWPQAKKGGVVLDLIVDCDVAILWKHFTGDHESSTLWRRLYRHRKYEEVETEPWEDRNEEEGRALERESTYITGFKSSFIRGKHKTYETQTVTLARDGLAYVMEVKAKVPTLPVGDCMYTVIQYCLGANGADSCCLQASYEIVYTKKASFKSLIEKNAASGVKDNMKDLRATLATIIKIRDALPSHLERHVAAKDAPKSLDSVVTHEIFRFLMQYSHAILAFGCILYLVAERGGLVGGATAPHQLSADEECDASDEIVEPGSTAARHSEFFANAVRFYVLGFVFKFFVLASHWIITNMSILLLLVFRLLRPLIQLSRRVTQSTIVKKVSAPLKGSLTAILKSLEVKKVIATKETTELSADEEDLSPGEVVPAAAEAAMIVSKIAKFNHLSPAAQAQAVKGLRDKKQAELVGQSSFIGRDTGEDSGLVVEEVFENQRYQPFRGWGSLWPGHFLPTDCGKWSDRIGLPKVGTQSQIFELVAPALPPNWVWLETEWQIDLSGHKSGLVDADGFYYGVMAFSGLKDYPPSDPEHAKKTMKKFVRRRRWIRTRIHSGRMKDVLMRRNSSIGDGKSVKAKIETLLGWRKPDLAQSLAESTSPIGADERSDPIATPEQPTDRLEIGQDVVLVEMFEQEERVGSHNEWTAPIDNTLKRFSNRDGSATSALFSDVSPSLPTGFKWVGHWNIDNSKEHHERIDEDGWSYGKDFAELMRENGSKMQTMEKKARRRRWIRHQRRMNEEEELASPQLDLPNLPPVDARSSRSSIQALDLPGSPSEERQGAIPHHRRSSSKSALDVLDLAASNQFGENGESRDSEEEETEEESQCTRASPSPLGKPGPLAGHLPVLERRSSLSSLASDHLFAERRLCLSEGDVKSRDSMDLTFADMPLSDLGLGALDQDDSVAETLGPATDDRSVAVSEVPDSPEFHESFEFERAEGDSDEWKEGEEKP